MIHEERTYIGSMEDITERPAGKTGTTPTTMIEILREDEARKIIMIDIVIEIITTTLIIEANVIEIVIVVARTTVIFFFKSIVDKGIETANTARTIEIIDLF